MDDAPEPRLPPASLEELVEQYMELPPLEKRIDTRAMLWDQFTTEDNLGDRLKKLGATLCRYPAIGGLITTFATTAVLDKAGMLPQGGSEFMTLESYILFGSIAAASLVKQYGLKDRSMVRPTTGKEANLLEKMRCGMLNNPHIAGVLSGAALTGLWLQANMMIYEMQGRYMSNPWLSEGVWAAPILGYIAGYTIMEMAKSNEHVKRGFEQHKRMEEAPKTVGEKLKAIYNWPFEHPNFFATAAGASYFAFRIVSNYETVVPSKLPAAVAWYGFNGLMAWAASYFGMSAVSWLMHSNTMSLMKDSAMRSLNSALGRTEKAIDCQRSIMEIPTTEGNECRNHFRLGDLYMKADRLEEALTEYYKGIELIDAKGRFYSNPLDVLGGLADNLMVRQVIDMIGSVGDKFSEGGEDALAHIEKQIKEGEQMPAGLPEKIYDYLQKNVNKDEIVRLKRFAGEVKHRELVDADRNMRRIICSDIENPELHLLYAKFLDTMGDSELAKQEYTLTTSILLGNPEIAGNFERIGVSRNEVMTYNADKFLNKTLIFKRSSRKEDIEMEYAALSIFYSELKEKVAKPLALIEHDGMSYLIMEHSGEKTLQDLAAEERLTYDTLSEAVGLLCEIQDVGRKYGAGA
jgi:tetratricopeptide (TPR) repeat protein